MATTSKTIRDVMTSNPTTIEPSTPVIEAARKMRDEDVGSLPIVEGGQLTGTITDRDITIRAVAEGRDPQGTTIGEIASRDLVTIDPQQTLEEAVRQVEEAGGTVAQAHVRVGDPDDEIVRFCEEQGDFGLLVIGSRGLGPVKRKLIGSVSESVVRHAHCPVLVART